MDPYLSKKNTKQLYVCSTLYRDNFPTVTAFTSSVQDISGKAAALEEIEHVTHIRRKDVAV